MSFNRKQPKRPAYLLGPKSVIDALRNGLPVDLVCLGRRDAAIESLAREARIKVELHSPAWFAAQVGSGVNHQNAVARVKTDGLFVSPEQLVAKVAAKPRSVVLVLDEITSPGNFGAILRTALATGVDGVVFKTNNQAEINTFVVKNSVGAVFYLNLVPVANLRYAIDKLKAAGFWSAAAVLGESSVDYREIDAPKLALILGNEDKGVSPLLAKEADWRIKIPTDPRVESLNVSVAAGILLFHYRDAGVK